jgi:hypothetical protein
MEELSERIASTINLLSDDLMDLNIKRDNEEFIKKLLAIGNLAIDLADALSSINRGDKHA